MKTIRITLGTDLIERVDVHVKRLGTTRSEFATEVLKYALERLDQEESEERHLEGYHRDPAKPGEFEVREADRAWGGDAWEAD